MPILDLPVRAYIEDRVRRAFPDRNWNRGSGINDLVIKAMAVLLQPLRHEIDIIKINQSVTNYPYMRKGDLDLLSANWGKTRQTGSRAIGNVRLYFDTATDYRFSYLEFTAVDGTAFVLVAPVTITAKQLLSNRQADGTFYYDVAVQSTGIGDRYAVPAGSIVTVANAPSGLIRVENVEDFKVTAPNESNYDVVNAMYRNLGLRNLVSPSAIRAPLLDQFAGVLDIFIAGADHPKMMRDLVTAKIQGLDTQIHLGGFTDIWVNTNSVVQKQVVLSYLPSSGLARLVSESQAAQNEVLYTFARSLIDVDGLYSSPDYSDVLLDESTAVLVSMSNLLNDTRVLGLPSRSRYQLAALDILSGTDMIAVPTKHNDTINSPLLTDITGLDFSETTMKAGDLLQFGTTVQKITRYNMRVLEVGPAVQDEGYITWNNQNDHLVIQPGDRYIPFENSDVCSVNDRCVIPGGPAAGLYRVLKVDGTGIWVGNVVARGTLAYQSYDASVDQYTYTYSGNLPTDVGNTSWIYLGSDEGFDQSPSLWLKIVSMQRLESGVQIVTQGGTDTPPAHVRLIQGLRDRVLDKTKIWFEQHAPANFGRSIRQLFGDEANTNSSNIGHTLYVNDLSTQIDVGETTISSLGLGRTAEVGNLILFDGSPVTINPGDLHITQGDGSKVSVVIDSITDENTIVFRPSLPFAIPAGTRFALMRNHKSVAQITVTSTNLTEKTLKLASLPMGIGDGVGYVLRHSSGQYIVSFSTAGVLRTLYFNPPRQATDLTFGATGYITANPSDIGRTVVQTKSGGGTAVGILTAFNNSTRVWTVQPNDPTVDIFTTSNTRVVSIQDSSAVGYCSSLSSLYATGYFDPNIGDIGAIVRQGTYVGVLNSFDSTAHTWTIRPLSDYDFFDSTDPDVVTFVDYGTGRPNTSKGFGVTYQPASSPQMNTGPVTLTLDRAPDASIVNGSTLNVFPRFPITGGMLAGKTFKTLNDADIQFDPFASTLINDDLCTLLGSNTDVYSVLGKTKTTLAVADDIVPDVIAVHNAPPEQPLVFDTVIPANTKNLSIPGSGIGFWAQHGRVLKLTVGADTYYLAVDGANGQDGINLIDAIPVSLYSDQLITYQIVEGFHIPFWTVLPANKTKYRIFRQPELGEVLFSGTTGQHTPSNPGVFSDPGVNFNQILKAYDLAPEDLVLYIDDGPAASTDPLVITNKGTNDLTIDADLSEADAASGLAYHIVRRNNAWNREFWANGVIQNDRKTIVIDVPDGWDVLRNGTYGEWVWDVISHPSGDYTLGNWATNNLTGTYNPSTKTITLNVASGQFTPSEVVPDTNGFDATLAGEPCRVMPRLIDRTAAHGLSGSVIESFNYYLRDFMALPVVRIQDVQLLNAQTLQSIRSLKYTLRVNDTGLRYSDVENNTLVIDPSELADAAGQPIRITYLSDLTIPQINSYLQAPDTRIVNGNQLAKRMETVSVDLSVQVRSNLTETDLGQQIAAFVNTFPSTIPLSKDRLIKYLYENNLISYIDVGSISLSGDYYQADGTVTHFDNSVKLFGSETACYLTRSVSVLQLADQVS